MPILFSHSGSVALARLRHGDSVLSFDLDGTLAPLVDRPNDAVVPAATTALLRLVAARWPTAVITGRGLADAASRLGFEPTYLVGNHGAEWSDGRADAVVADLQPCREAIRYYAAALRRLGIVVEDKRLSLALHYRMAADARAARQQLDELIATVPFAAQRLCVSHGHRVLNIASTAAPDKGDALRSILSSSGAAVALVVGDDVNDEPAYVAAPPGSVCVHIGSRSRRSAAAFRLTSQRQIDRLLRALLALKPTTARLRRVRLTALGQACDTGRTANGK